MRLAEKGTIGNGKEDIGPLRRDVGDERLVVLNRVARAVIESLRGPHPDYVFTYRGKPIATMNNNAWQ